MLARAASLQKLSATERSEWAPRLTFVCERSELTKACALPKRSEGRQLFSPHVLFLFGRGDAAQLLLGLGFGQKPEARLAPREVEAYVQKSIGTSAWAGKFHDRNDLVGLPSDERHRPSRDMVRGGIDA